MKCPRSFSQHHFHLMFATGLRVQDQICLINAALLTGLRAPEGIYIPRARCPGGWVESSIHRDRSGQFRVANPASSFRQSNTGAVAARRLVWLNIFPPGLPEVPRGPLSGRASPPSPLKFANCSGSHNGLLRVCNGSGIQNRQCFQGLLRCNGSSQG
jgi:hypothetical protein